MVKMRMLFRHERFKVWPKRYMSMAQGLRLLGRLRTGHAVLRPGELGRLGMRNAWDFRLSAKFRVLATLEFSI